MVVHFGATTHKYAERQTYTGSKVDPKVKFSVFSSGQTVKMHL